jgi:hypothetical protein
VLGALGLGLLLSLFCGVLCVLGMERAEVADPTAVAAAAAAAGNGDADCKGHLLMFQQCYSIRDD